MQFFFIPISIIILLSQQLIFALNSNEQTQQDREDNAKQFCLYEQNFTNEKLTNFDREFLIHFITDDSILKIQNDKQNYLLKTQAFNAIRIVWENHIITSKSNAIIAPILYFTKNLDLANASHSFLQILALQKARAILLFLSKNNSIYSNDSGIYLGITLSYFLQDRTKTQEILYYSKKWKEFGKDIPKNLMKMTSYRDSICTIYNITNYLPIP